MNPRMVVALGLVALIVLTLALMVGRQVISEPDPARESLVSGLREQINNIEALDIIGPDGKPVARLRRERERWRVLEKSNYEADFSLVHDLLRDLAEARRAEARTENPDWYGRLGVAEPGSGQADGKTVTFPGTDLPELIIGRADSAGIGRFARIRSESRSWLIDRSPEVPDTPLDWLERAIMDIPPSQLSEITIRHPDGDTARLRPADDGSDQWVLINVPEGREAAPRWEIRPVAGALSGLNLQDVRRHDEVPPEAVRALYRTRDGLNFVASLFEDPDGYWVHFSVTADTPATDNGELDEADTELAIDAAAVDGRLSPWQFALSERRFENMTRRLDDLLAEQE